MKDEHRNELPCPVCGGRSYDRGQLRTMKIDFGYPSESFWQKYVVGGTKLPFRRCNDCGNIQLFLKLPPDGTTKRRRDGDFE